MCVFTHSGVHFGDTSLSCLSPRAALLENQPSVTDVVKWYRKPSEVPKNMPISLSPDEVSLKYVARIRHKLKQASIM